MAKASPDTEFTLFENGLDFIWSAVEGLGGKSSKRSLKYAVLDLAAGIELILKERLRRSSWKLLFADPDKVNELAYKRGAFKSVGLESAIERLESECDVEFDETAERYLKAIRDKRNRIQHFDMVDSTAAVVVTTANALGVVIDFIQEELSDGLVDAEKNLLKGIRAKLADLEAFVSIREKGISAKLKRAHAVLPCPACQQEALKVDDGVACLFCGYKAQSREAASYYATSVLGITSRDLRKGADWPVGLCPGCDWEACVETGLDGSSGYLCFHCGERWAIGGLHECGHCGRWIDSEENDIAVCDDCIEEQVRRSD